MGLNTVVADLAAVTFPAICRACGHIVEGGAWAPLLCRRCGKHFPFFDGCLDLRRPLTGGAALARFEGPARALLVDLKYRGALRAGRALGRRMGEAEAGGSLLSPGALVVPIPLHWRRAWRRGHNQAAVLAAALCRARRHPPPVAVLRRCRATRAQVGLRRAQRAGNVRGAFSIRRRRAEQLVDRRVVLVDDVVTTGATAAEAAAALLRAGALEVRLYAAAAALQHPVKVSERMRASEGNRTRAPRILP